MSLITELKSLALMYDTNRLYINHSKTNYYMYHKDMNFYIVQVNRKLTQNSFRALRNNIKKMTDSKPVKVPGMMLVPLEAFEARFEKVHQFKGVIKQILDNNSNVTLGDLTGTSEIRYNPEINGVNIITKEYSIMESVYFNEVGQVIIEDTWKEYIKNAFLDRLVNFQVSATKYYIENCTAGLQGNTPVSNLQGFRTMRLQTQMYPVFMRFSDDVNLLYLQTKHNQPLLSDISNSFGFLKSLETTSLYGKLLKDVEEYHKGFVMFTTKKEIAEFLRLRTDYVEIETIMRLLIGKFMTGFYGVNEKNYKIEYAVGDKLETTVVYHNQLCTLLCKGVAVNILETLQSSEYYKVLTKNYMQSFENFDNTIRVKATTDNVVAERFGGLNILKEPDIMQVLTRFKEVLS